jgi:anaerobic magnesium-protoporphyrin IX monomethyl ester cyclase
VRTVPAIRGSHEADDAVSHEPNGIDVVLVGYQDQGNLGMGYLAACLRAHGFTVELCEVRDGPDRVADVVARARPAVVGFSLIFQFFLPQFRRVAAHLRQAGIRSHFTMGGHYPSLCHEDALREFPELDSVVRYEGELTLVDLVGRLRAGEDWHEVPGIAYLDDGAVRESAARSLVQDLDSLPFPHRPYAPEKILGFPTLPVLASRGCARRCSFCSIHTFYRTAPGKVVRVRKPEQVILEMLELNRDHGVRVFLFQDDDFPLWGRAGRRWVEELIERMREAELVDHAIWKISCRAEYLDGELFAALRDAGLFLVYMGIESGVDAGLEILHKQMTVEQNRAGVRVLKELGLMFSYGFMLFDPSSTFASVRENVGFLREIVGDGAAAATFCRMLPYGGTPIRQRLLDEGRLRGDITHPDYEFLDPRLDEYYRSLHAAARPWLDGGGLSHELNWAREELEVARRLVGELRGVDAYAQALTALTAESNAQLFGLVEDSSRAFEEEQDTSLLDAAEASATCDQIRARLLDLRNAFVFGNGEVLVAEVDAGAIRGPVGAPQIH